MFVCDNRGMERNVYGAMQMRQQGRVRRYGVHSVLSGEFSDLHQWPSGYRDAAPHTEDRSLDR